MTLFGFKEAEVAQLMRAVAAARLDRDQIEARFARAASSGLAEPGDGIAGLLVERLGPADALAALIERRPAEALAGDDLTVADAQQALDRWMPRLNPAAILQWLRQAARYGAQLCVPGDEHWPVASSTGAVRHIDEASLLTTHILRFCGKAHPTARWQSEVHEYACTSPM